MLEKLNLVVYTLNNIEVKGKDNMDKLLGCILTLEEIEDEIKKSKVEEGE